MLFEYAGVRMTSKCNGPEDQGRLPRKSAMNLKYSPKVDADALSVWGLIESVGKRILAVRPELVEGQPRYGMLVRQDHHEPAIPHAFDCTYPHDC